MKNSWIAPVAALVVGAAGGYISGKNTDTSPKSNGIEEAAPRTRSSQREESDSATNTKKKSRITSTKQAIRLTGNSNRIQALMDFYGGLTAAQLAEEATKLENLPASERMMASLLLFGRWAEVDPTAAMSFSNTMGMAGGMVRPTILQSWASVDPANAAKYYAQNPREFAMMDMMGGRGPMSGQSSSGIIASEWARQDPTAAMAWASSLVTGKGDAMSAVIGEVAKTDPRKAIELLPTLDPSDRAAAYKTVAEQYGAQDFSAAQSWIHTLPPEEQAAALSSALTGLSNTDPVLAAQQVQSMEDGDAKNQAIAAITKNLVNTDPKAAADFIKSQTNENAQASSMRDLMPTWANQDPPAALLFVDSFPPGKVRDSAAQSYVWSNNTSPPAELITLAESISDQNSRNRTIGIAAMRWMKEDPAAATAYVQASTSLSDNAKARILRGGKFWGGG